MPSGTAQRTKSRPTQNWRSVDWKEILLWKWSGLGQQTWVQIWQVSIQILHLITKNTVWSQWNYLSGTRLWQLRDHFRKRAVPLLQRQWEVPRGGGITFERSLDSPKFEHEWFCPEDAYELSAQREKPDLMVKLELAGKEQNDLQAFDVTQKA